MNLVVIIFCSILGLIIGTGFIKASYHFDYLKLIYPERYYEYKDYFSAFTIDKWNVHLQFLVLPYFKRDKRLEDSKSIAIVKSIQYYLKLNIFSFVLLLIYLIFLVCYY